MSKPPFKFNWATPKGEPEVLPVKHVTINPEPIIHSLPHTDEIIAGDLDDLFSSMDVTVSEHTEPSSVVIEEQPQEDNIAPPRFLPSPPPQPQSKPQQVEVQRKSLQPPSTIKQRLIDAINDPGTRMSVDYPANYDHVRATNHMLLGGSILMLALAVL